MTIAFEKKKKETRWPMFAAFGWGSFLVALGSYFLGFFIFGTAISLSKPVYLILSAIIFAIGVFLCAYVGHWIKKDDRIDNSSMNAWYLAIQIAFSVVAASLTYLFSKNLGFEPELTNDRKTLFALTMCLSGCFALLLPFAFSLSFGKEVKPVPDASRQTRAQKIVADLAPLFFVTYFILLWLGSIVAPTDVISVFLTTGIIGVAYQFKFMILVVYFLLVVIVNRRLPRIGAIAAYAVMALAFVALIFLLPKEITVISKNGNPITMTSALSDQISFYSPAIIGIIVTFCLFEIMPMAKISRSALTATMFCIVLIVLASIAYSLIFEFDKYVRFFTGEHTSKWDLDISSLYGNKNRFGLVLMAGFAALLSIFALVKNRFVRVVCFIGAIACTVLSLLVRSDDSFCAGAIGIAVWTLYWFFRGFKHSKKTRIACIVVASVALLVVGGLIACCLIEEVYTNVSFFAKIKDFFGQITTLSGRFEIWGAYFDNLSLDHLFHGAGYHGDFIFELYRSEKEIHTSLHNSLIDLFNRGGAIYIAFTAFLVLKNLRLIYKTRKSDRWLWISMVSLMATMLAHGAAEVFTPYTYRFLNTSVYSLALIALPLCSINEKASRQKADRPLCSI